MGLKCPIEKQPDPCARADTTLTCYVVTLDNRGAGEGGPIKNHWGRTKTRTGKPLSVVLCAFSFGFRLLTSGRLSATNLSDAVKVSAGSQDRPCPLTRVLSFWMSLSLIRFR